MKELKEKYEKLVGEYITEFVKKQDYEFDGWVADDIGGIAVFIEQYFFNFDNIRYDIDNDVEVGLIFKWQDFGIEKYFEEDKISNINYKSFIKLRPDL